MPLTPPLSPDGGNLVGGPLEQRRDQRDYVGLRRARDTDQQPLDREQRALAGGGVAAVVEGGPQALDDVGLGWGGG